MVNKSLVKELVQKGYGRRRIAQILETTEWQARTLMQEVLKTKDLSATKQKTGKPANSSAKSKPFPKQKKEKPAPTSIQAISPIAQQGDTPSRMVIRPVSLKVAVVSDVHYPFEDRNALSICKAYLKDYQPDMIVMNGDIADCYSISRYDKSPTKRMTIQEELDYTRDRLEEWVTEFPNTEFKYLEGNHENRFDKIISVKAPELATLRTLSFKDNLGLDDLDIEWIPHFKDLQIGNLLFLHGHRVRKYAGTTARGHFDDYGCSLLVGHIHRLAIGWRRNKYGNHALIENGTLCDLDVEYARFPDWQHGFTTIEFDGDDFSPRQHAINEYKLIAEGKVYAL